MLLCNANQRLLEILLKAMKCTSFEFEVSLKVECILKIFCMKSWSGFCEREENHVFKRLESKKAQKISRSQP